MKKKFSQAEWSRLADAAEDFGISRPELFRHLVVGDIVGVHVKKPGAQKGVWLVKRSLIEEFIHSFLPGGSRYQKPNLQLKKGAVTK